MDLPAGAVVPKDEGTRCAVLRHTFLDVGNVPGDVALHINMSVQRKVRWRPASSLPAAIDLDVDAGEIAAGHPGHAGVARRVVISVSDRTVVVLLHDLDVIDLDKHRCTVNVARRRHHTALVDRTGHDLTVDVSAVVGQLDTTAPAAGAGSPPWGPPVAVPRISATLATTGRAVTCRFHDFNGAPAVEVEPPQAASSTAQTTATTQYSVFRRTATVNAAQGPSDM